MIVVASLTASAPPARVPSIDRLETPSVPAVRTDAPTPAFDLRPSRNRQFDVHIEAAAAKHGVSRELVRAVIQVESGFDRRAVSRAGARGLMQLMPATARRFGVTNRFDARQNIFGGTRYLRVLLDRYQGDISLTAAAYNAGEGSVARHYGIPPYKETQDYVRKITSLLGAAERQVNDGEGGTKSKG